MAQTTSKKAGGGRKGEGGEKKAIPTSPVQEMSLKPPLAASTVIIKKRDEVCSVTLITVSQKGGQLS